MLSILVQLILIARTKFLEDAFGLNSLLKAHKWFGILSLSAVLAHVSLFMGSLYAGSLSLMLNDYAECRAHLGRSQKSRFSLRRTLGGGNHLGSN
jgi:predicted ferric reductase